MKKIYKALSDFQQEVPVIHQGSTGYGYTFASLGEIFKVINPLLKKHGLGFTQLLEGDALKTIIFHVESGEEITSVVNIQQDVSLAKMNTFQVIGSAITYYRRYSLSAALALITDKDIDSSGVTATPIIAVNSAAKSIESCKTLDELKAVFSKLTGAEKIANEACKNKAKAKLIINK